MESIDERPRDYDLEHEGDDVDVAFYARRLHRWRPRRVLELARAHRDSAGWRGDSVDRYVSDFYCHIYYPREVELLFRTTGFAMEGWFGD